MVREAETPTFQRILAEALKNKKDRISIRRGAELKRTPAVLFLCIGPTARRELVPDLNRICNRHGFRNEKLRLQLDATSHLDNLFQWLETTNQNYCTAALKVSGTEVWMFACVGATFSLEVVGLLNLRGCPTKV